MIEYRNSAFVCGLLVLLQVLEQSGVSRDDFLRQAGFAPNQLEGSERSITLSQYLRAVEAAHRLASCNGLDRYDRYQELWSQHAGGDGKCTAGIFCV